MEARITTPLWNHQQEALEFARSRPAALLNMEMGTGKTLTALAWIVKEKFNRVLIVCPKKAVPVWEDQIQDHTEGLDVFSFDRPGNLSKRLREWEKQEAQVSVINYALIRQAKALKAFESQFDAIILDEGHRIKSHNSKQSKICWKLGRSVERRLILTGTPFHNSPSDIFGQARFLDETIFGKAWYKFRDQYEVTVPLPMGKGVLKTIGYKNTPELQEKLKPIMHTVKITDVLDMPEQLNITQRVVLPASVMKVYREFKKEMITEIDNGVITAQNALVKSLRLRQLAGGFLSADRSQVVEHLHNEKIDVLAELLDSIGDDKLVIFAQFTAEIRAIRQLLESQDIPYIEISGSVNEYRHWSEVGCAVVQIAAGSEAIDLTPAQYAVYYSLPHSLGVYQQSRARIWRPGATQTVKYYHLLAEGTLDYTMYEALRKKKNVNESILRGIRDV